MEQGISDEELREVIQSSIMKKPKAHQFGEIEDSDNNEVTLEERKMSQIGG
jgi:hypothetical protein